MKVEAVACRAPAGGRTWAVSGNNRQETGAIPADKVRLRPRASYPADVPAAHAVVMPFQVWGKLRLRAARPGAAPAHIKHRCGSTCPIPFHPAARRERVLRFTVLTTALAVPVIAYGALLTEP
jgi:hypothetical protein